MSKVLGVDLGTTNSCMSVMEAGKPVVIANAEGFRTTPSIVAFTKAGDELVGQIAGRQSVMNASNTYSSVKRFIGKTPNEVSEDSKSTAYEVVEEKGKVKIKSSHKDKLFSPEEISAKVLRKLATDAEKYLGEKVTQAVVTVPAYFNDAERQATKNAAEIAGLEVLRIINEPTAAALAYGLEKNQDGTILVFDLGGGTFDVSVLDVADGVFEVLSTSGNSHLGGDDFDKVIVNYMVDTFKVDEGIDLKSDKQALQRLYEAAEKAKIELSSSPSTDVNLPFITATDTGPKHLTMTLTRAKFESLATELIAACAKPVNQALTDAKLSASEIDEVVMVGGSTRIPAVQDLVKELTGKELNQTVNPDEVVAIGAAIQGGVLSGDVSDILLLDVTPLSLGVEVMGGVVQKMISRNTTIPASKTEVYSTAQEGQTSVEIHILQGERQMAVDNKSLGKFKLDGIPPAPRGVPQIEVSFDINADGILSVKAQDKGSGKEQSITITGSSTLSEDEVNQMVKDAEENAAADEAKRALVDARNYGESLINQSETMLKDMADKVSEEDSSKLNEKIAELKELIQSDNTAAIVDKNTELQSTLQMIGAAAYQQADATSKPEEDVIDVELD